MTEQTGRLSGYSRAGAETAAARLRAYGFVAHADRDWYGAPGAHVVEYAEPPQLRARIPALRRKLYGPVPEVLEYADAPAGFTGVVIGWPDEVMRRSHALGPGTEEWGTGRYLSAYVGGHLVSLYAHFRSDSGVPQDHVDEVWYAPRGMLAEELLRQPETVQ